MRSFTRAGVRVQAYPWDKLLLGDFFVTPILGSKNALITTFRQAAARRDIEVTIRPWVDSEGRQCIRVCKIQENIRAVKRKASKIIGTELPVSDGQWKERRHKTRRIRHGVEQDDRPTPTDAPTGPVTEPPVPVTEAQIAPLGYNRSERLREAQARAKEEMGLDKDDVNYFEEITE